MGNKRRTPGTKKNNNHDHRSHGEGASRQVGYSCNLVNVSRGE